MKPEDLARCTGATLERAKSFSLIIDSAMAEFNIDTPLRQAAFLAQVGHESGGLHWLTEIWGPTKAQLTYEGRKDLGNIKAGDGKRFLGRGLIQTTGRNNYAKVSKALGVDFLTFPEKLAEPVNAARSAAYFWSSNNLNKYADLADIKGMTRRINGGYNGLAEREKLYVEAQFALC